VTKDTQRLPAAYHAAGVPEFWLLDARGAVLVFQIQRRGERAYEPAAADREGYQHSSVLSAWYRLVSPGSLTQSTRPNELRFAAKGLTESVRGNRGSPADLPSHLLDKTLERGGTVAGAADVESDAAGGRLESGETNAAIGICHGQEQCSDHRDA
jgi:hypothetical protein